MIYIGFKNCNNTAEEMHKEQERIKTSIINFEQDLWEY